MEMDGLGLKSDCSKWLSNVKNEFKGDTDYGLNCDHHKIHMLKYSSQILQKVTVFGHTVFKEAIKLK